MMDTLCFLKIICDMPGMVEINGALIGQTPSDGITHYVPAGQFLLSFTPLSNTEHAFLLPFSRLLSLRQNAVPQIICDDGLVQLYVLPQGGYLLRLCPPKLMRPDAGFTLTSHNFTYSNRNLRAEVYFDQGFYFSLQEGSRILLLSPLGEDFSEANIFTRRIGNIPYLFMEGLQENKPMLFCCGIGSPTVYFYEPCVNKKFIEAGVELHQSVTHPSGRLLRTQFLFKNNDCTQHMVGFTEDADISGATDAGYALLMAMKYGREDAAMACLTPSLRREISFADLQDFFGEIDAIETGFGSTETIGISTQLSENIHSVRLFTLTMEEGLIENIVEVDEAEE